MNKTPKNDNFALSGDFDARIVIITVPNMAFTFKENTINNNGQELKQFSTFNDIKFTNSFYTKKI